MQTPPNKPVLIVVVGPTAVGKTSVAIELAERLSGEIVSADSRTFYRGLDIGTAKPTAAERARVPHHLVDVADPDEIWSLAVFQQAAAEAIASIHGRGNLPFLVGGSGQYIEAVTHGWVPPKTKPNDRMRQVLTDLVTTNGSDWLYKKLEVIDPVSAQRIDGRNIRRTIRAFEVIFATGVRFSDQRGHGESSYRMIMIGLNRPRVELYARIDERIESMFAGGLLDEVHALLAHGCSPTSPALSAIGYRECVKVLEERMSLEEARLQMRRATRVFVRRQANWFKAHDPRIKWFTLGESNIDDIECYLRDQLSQGD
jgi:tRNA dimethylallyltransferase